MATTPSNTGPGAAAAGAALAGAPVPRKRVEMIESWYEYEREKKSWIFDMKKLTFQSLEYSDI